MQISLNAFLNLKNAV